MDGPRDDHTNKSERERQIPYDITYMWNLKYSTNEPLYKKETDSQTYRTDLWLPSGKGKGGRTESLRLADVNYYVQDGKTRCYCIT